MYGRGYQRSQWRFDKPATIDRHLECVPKQRLRRCSAEAHDDARMNDSDFGVKPWTACTDFRSFRLRVYTSFPSRLPFEVLHDVRDVSALPFYACLLERLVQNAARRTDKRMTRQVFVVARLFSHEHDRS